MQTQNFAKLSCAECSAEKAVPESPSLPPSTLPRNPPTPSTQPPRQPALISAFPAQHTANHHQIVPSQTARKSDNGPVTLWLMQSFAILRQAMTVSSPPNSTGVAGRRMSWCAVPAMLSVAELQWKTRVPRATGVGVSVSAGVSAVISVQAGVGNMEAVLISSGNVAICPARKLASDARSSLIITTVKMVSIHDLVEEQFFFEDTRRTLR